VVRILLTGAATLGSALQAINEGEVVPLPHQALGPSPSCWRPSRAAAARVEEAGRLLDAGAAAQRKAS
jgi:hypothetical protein